MRANHGPGPDAKEGGQMVKMRIILPCFMVFYLSSLFLPGQQAPPDSETPEDECTKS
jgi:hypothetical protein